MIISLYAGGMTLRDIQYHLVSTIGTELSHETISKITDQVAEEVLIFVAAARTRGHPPGWFTIPMPGRNTSPWRSPLNSSRPGSPAPSAPSGTRWTTPRANPPSACSRLKPSTSLGRHGRPARRRVASRPLDPLVQHNPPALLDRAPAPD